MSDFVVMLPCPKCKRPHGWTPKVAGKEIMCSCGRPFRMPTVDEQGANDELGYGLEPAYDSKGKRLGDGGQNTDDGLEIDLAPDAPPPPTAAKRRTEEFATAADQPMSLPAARRRTRYQPQEEEEEKSFMAKNGLVIAGVVLAAFLCLGIYSIYVSQNPSPTAAKGVAGAPGVPALKGEDAEVLEAFDQFGQTELKAWLKENPRAMLMGMSRSQAEGLADRLYGLGAIRVVAFGGVVSTAVAIQLPTDPAKRKAIFDWVRDRNRDMSFPFPPDVGQNYLLYRLTP